MYAMIKGFVLIVLLALLGTGWFWRGQIQAAPMVSPVLGSDPQVAPPLEGPTLSEPPALPTAYRLSPSRWIGQTMNNCGPAATAMALQHFGITISQEEAKQALRTDTNDKNVTAQEIVAYVQTLGIQSRVQYNGSLTTLKTLLANGIPVMVEDWLKPNEDIGHFTLLIGYDDVAGVLIADDPYHGPEIKLPYNTFDRQQWQPFNRTYLPLYRSEQQPLVQAIIGDDWDETTMYRHSVAQSQVEIAANAQDVYAWFNLGEASYRLGKRDTAETAFATARQIGWPARFLWYRSLPIQ